MSMLKPFMCRLLPFNKLSLLTTRLLRLVGFAILLILLMELFLVLFNDAGIVFSKSAR